MSPNSQSSEQRNPTERGPSLQTTSGVVAVLTAEFTEFSLSFFSTRKQEDEEAMGNDKEEKRRHASTLQSGKRPLF